MATFIKRPTFTSPKGTFKFPSLSKPDFGNVSFPKPDGEYKTGLIVPAAQAAEIIRKLQPEYDAAIEEGQAAFALLPLASRKKMGSLKEQPFYTSEYDPQTEQETGNVIFTFKTKASLIDKKSGEKRVNKIGLFDSKGAPLAAGTSIYGGTVGKIAFTVAPYFVAGQGMAGISLRLNAAQVIELVGPGAASRSANAFGFGVEDGGYESTKTEAQQNGFDDEDQEEAPRVTSQKAAQVIDEDDF